MELSSELMAIFVEEAKELVDELSARVAELEQATDEEAKASLGKAVYRAVHTLKGAADAAGFDRLKEVSPDLIRRQRQQVHGLLLRLYHQHCPGLKADCPVLPS